MFKVTFAPANNTLMISYGGLVTPDETRLCGDEVRLALTTLQPGFRLTADLTELRAMEMACSPEIGRIMEMCNAAGAAEVVRIIPHPTRDIGLQIMSLFHYGANVSIRTWASAAEMAEALAAENQAG